MPQNKEKVKCRTSITRILSKRTGLIKLIHIVLQSVSDVIQAYIFSPHWENQYEQVDANKGMITKHQSYCIQRLWQRVSRDTCSTSLRELIKRVTGLDALRFLDRYQASEVIVELHNISRKSGGNLHSTTRVEAWEK